MLNPPASQVPTIKILPNKESATRLIHPNGPVLGDGALWPNDSFTARRLADRSVVRATDEVSSAPEASPETHPAG